MARSSSKKVNPQSVTSSSASDRWKPAIRHLRKVDVRLRAIIDDVGPCLLEPRSHRFDTLVRAIIGQQISSKAAAAIDRRLKELSSDPHDPHKLRTLGETAIRTAGLSGVKAKYVINLAEAVASGEVPVDDFDDTWTDEEIVASLVSIKGIGVWTAEMFLMFALNRPDILPVGDLGIRAGIRMIHDLEEIPKPSECHALAEHWRPYRTIACWYLWRGLEAAPKPIKKTGPVDKE